MGTTFKPPAVNQMAITELTALYLRDLRSLRKEIESFSKEADLWRTLPGISNSAGNLSLHLCGNLRHYIGHVLGGEAYVRDRPNEFAAKGLSKAQLVEEIDRTLASVEHGLGALPASRLDTPFPASLPVETNSAGHFLLHLYGHLSYHLGQVNYLRRMLEP